MCLIFNDIFFLYILVILLLYDLVRVWYKFAQEKRSKSIIK